MFLQKNTIQALGRLIHKIILVFNLIIFLIFKINVMKKYVFLIRIITNTLSYKLYSQNLVKNSEFEDSISGRV